MRFDLRTLLIVVTIAPAIVWFSTVKLAELTEGTHVYKPNRFQPDRQLLAKVATNNQRVSASRAAARSEAPGPTLKELLKQEGDGGQNSPADAVRDHLSVHAGPRWGIHRHRLVISWFIGNGTTALRYTVTESGISEDVREVYNWASQDWQRKWLSADNLKRLAELLPQLPESKAEPPIERTVHISFQSGDQWRTETYDAAALPAQFEQVMLILGERSETHARHQKKAD
jgi:hypothetical protein